MAKDNIKAPAFDDIVFASRNKEYGAYSLRKKYKPTVILAILIGILILSTLIIAPYLNAKANESAARKEKTIEIEAKMMEAPVDQVAPPPPPPPPPPADIVRQAAYVPPVVVDSVKPEEEVQLLTAEEAEEYVTNTEVVDQPIEQMVEVQEAEPEEVPFYVVEEEATFPGGLTALYDYIGKNLQYPPEAVENNIQGKVTVRFCVTSKGTINQISVLKGVDAALDAEAMRVVSTLPPFKPGKQGGRPVPVWYMLPITFKLN
ncbi:MAG TPA: energy transducer TonB [Bacteroidales bacterium]|nr:energy transducer TonB [Bacteroidales bacterium]